MEMLEMFWRRSHLHHLLPSSQPNFLASAALGLSPSAYSHLTEMQKALSMAGNTLSMLSMVSIVSMMNKVSKVRIGSLLELFLLAHTMRYLGFDQRLILRTQISPVTLFSSPAISLRLKWENHYFLVCLEKRWVWHLFQKVDWISRFWPQLAIFTNFLIFFSVLLCFGLLQNFLCYSSPLSSWPKVAEWVSITQWHKNRCTWQLFSEVQYVSWSSILVMQHTLWPSFVRPCQQPTH